MVCGVLGRRKTREPGSSGGRKTCIDARHRAQGRIPQQHFKHSATLHRGGKVSGGEVIRQPSRTGSGHHSPPRGRPERAAAMAGIFYPKREGTHVATDAVESFVPEGDWAPEEEAKVLRKLDNRILLPCFLMMFIGYLDRQNMANAKVLNAGKPDSIEQSWGLTGSQYNWVISIYGIGLFITEPWTNFLLKKMSPPTWFARIMVTWGAIVMCQAAVTNFAGAMATRFFLGVAEGGLLPGVPYYLSFWYTQRERGVRMGISYTGLGTAGMVGGFIAMGVQNMNGAGGLLAWQWLFIIEGIPAVLFGIVIYFFLPAYPQDAKFLTESQKDISIRRLPPNAPSSVDKIDMGAIKKELKDPVLWLFFGAMLFIVIPIAGAAALLPSIILGLGFKTSTQANGLAAAVNAMAVVTTLLNTWHSDWVNERYWHVMGTVSFFALCGSLPLAITATNPTLVSPGGRLAFVLLAGVISSSYPIVWAYRANTAKGTSRATVNSALTLTAYAGGLVVGPQLFPNQDAPNYVPGMWASFGLYWAGLLCFSVIPLVLRRQLKNDAEDARIVLAGHEAALPQSDVKIGMENMGEAAKPADAVQMPVAVNEKV
ncbi:major facilitator superfamily domain-containing protein [Hyaloraphidium curvatum]|nr:major facilitator superfamily domain-containing protein [Hyaloraphidium curvatum]